MTRRRLAVACCAAGIVACALPAHALAHGLVQRSDLPIPKWLFGWAAVLVLLVSFVALASLWREPKLEGDAWRPVSVPLGRALTGRAAEIACGATGVVLLAVVVWSGFDGVQEPTDNFAPTFVYVIFWVGLVAASALLGDVFRPFNPWRALARAVAALAARGRVPAPLPYPERLGRWPAVAGIALFACMELVVPGGSDPRNVAIAAIAYSVVTLVAMSVWGIDAWVDRGEAFSAYFGLFARLSPFELRGRVLGVRRPLSGLTGLDARVPGTVALLATMIGSVTFDGATEGAQWPQIRQSIADFLVRHSLPTTTATTLASVLGLIACIALALALYGAGIALVRRAAGGESAAWVRAAFVHTLVPIAAAYVGAHYLSFVLTQGQAIVPLASDPLGHGWDVFGTAGDVVDYGVIGVTATWYAQVALVVTGHMAGLTTAHDRALRLYGAGPRATRSQYGMLAVMVLFTLLALTLLAQVRL